MTTALELADRLEATRQSRGLTRQALTTRAGVSRQAVYRLFRGHDVQLSTLLAVMEVLQLDLATLPRTLERGLPELGAAGASVAGQAISASATSYAAQCQKFKDEDAQAVFAASDLATAKRLVKQCAEQDYKPLWIDNPQNWKDSELTDPAWEGLVLSAPEPLWFGDGPGTAEFLAAMKKYQPKAILNNSTTAGWYTGKVFEDVLKKVSGEVTSQAIYDGLYALGPNYDLGGIIGPVTYTKGQPAKQGLCAWFAQVKDRALTTPFGPKRVCVEE